MTTLTYIWESINDFIALQGTSGACLSNVFESLKVPKYLQVPILHRLFGATDLCSFYRAATDPSGASTKRKLTFQDFKADPSISYENIYCVADISMSWKAYGFESYYDIPESQTPLLLSVLEILGMAREKGCSNTEISMLLGIPKLHTVVERIVSLGYVIKRVVLPLNGKGASCRVKSRTVLLHLKRFAAHYDPSVDDIEIEADEVLRVGINYYFTKLLNYHGLQEMAATDAAQAIGIGGKKLIKLKDSFASYVKAGLAEICFVDREVPLLYPGRQPGVRLRSCLGFVASPIVMKAGTDHEVAINAPIYEQSTAMLRWSNGEGVSSSILRVKLCLYAKRAARVAIELNTVHGYPMKKQQAGKTLVNQLYDMANKQKYPMKEPIRRTPSDQYSADLKPSEQYITEFDSSAVKDVDTATPRSNMNTRNALESGDFPLDALGAHLSDPSTDNNNPTSSSSSSCSSSSSGPHDPTNIKSESEKGLPSPSTPTAKMHTDLRSCRLQSIMDTLAKNGGVSSFPEMTYWIRQSDIVYGVQTKVDRKTIQRLLNCLQAEKKVIQLSAALPKGISLVITKEGTTITTMSNSINETPGEAKLIVQLDGRDPQLLLTEFMAGLMSALELRKAQAPKAIDRASRVLTSVMGGARMRRRAGRGVRGQGRRRKKGEDESDSESSESSEEESVGDESSSSSDNDDENDDDNDDDDNSGSDSDNSKSHGSQSDTQISHSTPKQSKSKKRIRTPIPKSTNTRPPRSAKRKSLKADKDKEKEQGDSDGDFPLPLPLSLPHIRGMSVGAGPPVVYKIDPRVGFLKGGRVRRRKGKDVLERSIALHKTGMSTLKWHLNLLGTLTALRAPGLFVGALNMHFEIARRVIRVKTFAAVDVQQRSFHMCDLLKETSLQFCVRNYLFPEHLQRLIVDEQSALVECTTSDDSVTDLILALKEDRNLKEYINEEIGGIFVRHMIETQLGGVMAVMVAVGVLEPTRDVYRIAENILEVLTASGDGFGVRDDIESDGEGIAMDLCVGGGSSAVSKQDKGTKSSKKKRKEKEKDGDSADEESYSPSEKVLQIFAYAALHARVNYRKHSRDMKHNPVAEALLADLLSALSTCEFELSIYPTGNQGAVWTEGDILHYWRYCVNATLQKVDMTRAGSVGKKFKRSEEDDDDDNDQNDVETLNKFYAPMMSSQIKQRWSDIGLDLQDKDFFELRTVRQRRFLIKERMEVAESESGADIDECQATTGDHSSGSSGEEGEGEGDESRKLDAKAKKALRKDRRAYSSIGFTALGLAGCVSGPPLDPSLQPRARARKKTKIDAPVEEESVPFEASEENPEIVELQDDWISVPGIGHHSIRGDTFESLQQEEWTNVQSSMALEICLREYFLKKKTLPAPLFRFFDLQRVLKERKIKELEDIEIEKQNEIDKAARRKHREKEKLKLAGMLRGFEGEKQIDVDAGETVLSTDGGRSNGDGDGEDVNKNKNANEGQEADIDTEVQENRESNTDGTSDTVQPIQTEKDDAALIQKATEITGGGTASPGTGPIPEGDRPSDGVDPDAPTARPISQRFLTDPAYALIDRDYCSSHLTAVVRRIRTFGTLLKIPGKTAPIISRRVAALLKPGAKNFTESLSVRQTIALVLCHKASGPPSERAASMDLDLRVTLNGILDPSAFAARQAKLLEEDRLRYCGVNTTEDAMYGTSVPLGKAAITRAIQVYSDSNSRSKKRGLATMLNYPVGAVARAQRELCWNDWIYYPSSKGRRLGPRRGFVITGAFYGNLIAPLCSSFGLLVRPNMTSSQINELSGVEGDTAGKRKRSEEVEVQDANEKTKKSRNENEKKESEATGDDDCENRTKDLTNTDQSDMDTGCMSSTNTSQIDELVSTQQQAVQCESRENPWLLRSIVLAERVDDSRAEAVNVQEAVMFTHAFGMETMFDKCEVAITVSEPSAAEGEAGREAEKNGGGDEADPTDTEETDRDTGDGPSDDPPEEGLRLRARIEMTMPISYVKAFSLIKGMGAQDVPLQRIKSLAAVHLGNYCSHLNRLQFDLTLQPVEVQASSSNKSHREGQINAPSVSTITDSNSDNSNDTSSSTPAKSKTSESTSVSIDNSVKVAESNHDSGTASDSTLKGNDEGSVEMECDDTPNDNVRSAVEVDVEAGGRAVEEATDSRATPPPYSAVESWMLHMVKAAGSEGMSLDELQQAYLKRNIGEMSTIDCALTNNSSTSASSSSGRGTDGGSGSASGSGGHSGSGGGGGGGGGGENETDDVSASETIPDPDPEDSEDNNPDFECVGAVLKAAGEIVVDNGYGFMDISAHCVEPFEKHDIHFVHSEHAKLYILKTDSTLFPGEGSCPWVSVDGNRNELFYRMLRAKVASVLSQRPGTSLKALFAGFPQLTLNQVNVLVSTMAREGLLYARTPTVSSRKSGPFQSSMPSHAPVTGYYLRL